MISAALEACLQSTMPLVSQVGDAGTSFLVRQGHGPGMHVYLVTNKHVIGPTAEARSQVQHVVLHPSRLVDGVLTKVAVELPLIENGAALLREHPDFYIDVAAIRADRLLADHSLGFRVVDPALIATDLLVEQLRVSIGDEVWVPGYPLMKHQSPSSRPILKPGVIASPLRGQLKGLALSPDGQEVERTVEGFWVDVQAARGSSGSPVILKPERILAIGAGAVPVQSPPLVLGVLAGVEYGVLDGHRVDIGLGLVFNSWAIQQTLDLFIALPPNAE